MQSVHLQKMMQKHKRYPEYDLAFPLLSVKKKSLKKLGKGDVFLLGLDFLDLTLMKEGRICAKLTLENSVETVKLKIVSVEEKPVISNDNKKYENILCVFGKIQSRKLEVGHKVEIPALVFEEVELFMHSNKLAKGSLVTVDDEIAVEITEVKNG